MVVANRCCRRQGLCHQNDRANAFAEGANMGRGAARLLTLDGLANMQRGEGGGRKMWGDGRTERFEKGRRSESSQEQGRRNKEKDEMCTICGTLQTRKILFREEIPPQPPPAPHIDIRTFGLPLPELPPFPPPRPLPAGARGGSSPHEPKLSSRPCASRIRIAPARSPI